MTWLGQCPPSGLISVSPFPSSCSSSLPPHHYWLPSHSHQWPTSTPPSPSFPASNHSCQAVWTCLPFHSFPHCFLYIHALIINLFYKLYFHVTDSSFHFFYSFSLSWLSSSASLTLLLRHPHHPTSTQDLLTSQLYINPVDPNIPFYRSFLQVSGRHHHLTPTRWHERF